MEKIHNPERLAGESQLAYRHRQKVSRALAGRATVFWNPRGKGSYTVPQPTTLIDGTPVAYTRKQLRSMRGIVPDASLAQKEAEQLDKRTERANRQRLGMDDAAAAAGRFIQDIS